MCVCETVFPIMLADLEFKPRPPIFIVITAEQQLHSRRATWLVGQQQLNRLFEPLAPPAVVTGRGGAIKSIKPRGNL